MIEIRKPITNINQYIDQTNIKAEAQPEEIDRLCYNALEYRFASVAVNPCYVKRSAKILKNSMTAVDCAVGFPFGANTSKTKALEAQEAIDNGAKEIDMVINIGQLKSGNDQYITKDIREVAKVTYRENAILKVVIETILLTYDEKVRACLAALNGGADFVKTSTGTRSGGATIADVLLMVETVGNRMQVKAAGGIRSWETAKKLIEAGATRLGTSEGIIIFKEAQNS